MAESRAPGISGPTSDDDVYVGYLPTPRRHRRAVRLAVPILLWIGVCVAGVSAWRLRDPGPAVWDLSAQITETGALRLRPYPHLVLRDGAGNERERLLLGEEFKMGVGARLDGLVDGLEWADSKNDLDRRVASASGWVMERDGRRLLALAPGDDGLRIQEQMSPATSGADGLGSDERERVTLVGEILDGKCYLGAMKPGDGAAHRACAMLCLRGGLPALFVVRTGEDAGRVLWIADEAGNGISHELIPLVAKRVEARGRVWGLGEAEVLLIESARALP